MRDLQARSTPYNMPGGAQGYTSFDNYTDSTWPDWPVPVYQCLPRGVSLIEAQGCALKELIQEPVLKVLADSSASNSHLDLSCPPCVLYGLK